MTIPRIQLSGGQSGDAFKIRFPRHGEVPLPANMMQVFDLHVDLQTPQSESTAAHMLLKLIFGCTGIADCSEMYMLCILVYGSPKRDGVTMGHEDFDRVLRRRMSRPV